MIVRTDRIGDVMLSLPLIDFIKQKYPLCKITFLLREYTSALALDYDGINEVLLLIEQKGKPNLLQNVIMLRRQNIDTVIVVYPTFIISLIIFLSGIKKRIGTGYRWYSFFFTHKVYEHRKTAERHELEYNLNLLKQIGINQVINESSIKFHLTISVETRNKVLSILTRNKINLDKPIIIVHPGSGGSAVDLPIPKMIKLMELLSTLECYIFVTGNKSEVALCQELVVKDNIFNFAGEFELNELVALIDLSIIFISNSTGPLHIAAALNKYVVGFYPKILACSPKRWGPYTQKKIIVMPEIDCSNCDREQCEKLNCMDSININNVFANVQKIYKLHLNNGDFHAE
ncbi:MAG: glycosyltransferase family 9 protein [Ignavibacteria bacterium]|nr:glycosyltransferase family 9 protein [Ignavibacteria bacterium]